MNPRDAFGRLDRVPIPTELLRMAEDRAMLPEGELATGTASPGRGRGRVAAIAVAGALSALALALVFAALRPGSRPSPPGEGAPLSAVLVCDENGTHADTTEVQAQGDGVHLVVQNRLPYDPGLIVAFDGEGTGRDLEPDGVTRLTLAIPPGGFTVACRLGPDMPVEDVLSVAPRLQVVDPEGLYVSPTLECSGETVGEVASPGGVEAGTDPVQVATDALAHFLAPDDVVEVAGYPEAVPRLMRVIRGGSVIMRVELVLREDGTWTSDVVERCASLLPQG